MTIMGDWTNGDYTAKKFTDYGWAPRRAPRASSTRCPTPSRCRRTAQAADKDAKTADLLASAEGQDAFNPLKGSIPANIDAGNPRLTASSTTTT